MTAPLKLAVASSADASAIDYRMMQRAIELAQQAAAMDEVPVGAVVYRGEEIIAEACNVREANHDPLGHAEVLAIRRASDRLKSWRLSGCSLAVTLEPCPMCAGAIVNARLDRVVYGARDPKAGACESLYEIASDERLNHRAQIISGVMETECSRMLVEFFKRRRRENKERRRQAG